MAISAVLIERLAVFSVPGKNADAQVAEDAQGVTEEGIFGRQLGNNVFRNRDDVFQVGCVLQHDGKFRAADACHDAVIRPRLR